MSLSDDLVVREYFGYNDIKVGSVVVKVFNNDVRNKDDVAYQLTRLNQYIGQASVGGKSIEKGVTVLWANGQRVFSSQQLGQILNGDSVCVHVERQGRIESVLVPIVKRENQQLSLEETRYLDALFFTSKETVKNEFHRYINKGDMQYMPIRLDQDLRVTKYLTNHNIDVRLDIGDRIVAVNGRHVKSQFDVIRAIYNPMVRTIIFDENKYPLANKRSRDAQEKYMHDIMTESHF